MRNRPTYSSTLFIYTFILFLACAQLGFSQRGGARRQSPVFLLSGDSVETANLESNNTQTTSTRQSRRRDRNRRRGDSHLNSGSDNSRALDLIFNLHPSVIVNNNTVSDHSGVNNPVSLFTDRTSINSLNQPQELYEHVELITIELQDRSELNNPIDFSRVRGFYELKYIYIKSNFQMSESQIRSFITNTRSRTSIIYKTISQS